MGRNPGVGENVPKLDARATTIRGKACSVTAHPHHAPAIRSTGKGGSAAVTRVRCPFKLGGLWRTLAVPEKVLPRFRSKIERVSLIRAVVEVEEKNAADGVGVVWISEDFAIDDVFSRALPVRRGPGFRLGVVAGRSVSKSGDVDEMTEKLSPRLINGGGSDVRYGSGQFEQCEVVKLRVNHFAFGNPRTGTKQRAQLIGGQGRGDARDLKAQDGLGGRGTKADFHACFEIRPPFAGKDHMGGGKHPLRGNECAGADHFEISALPDESDGGNWQKIWKSSDWVIGGIVRKINVDRFLDVLAHPDRVRRNRGGEPQAEQ